MNVLIITTEEYLTLRLLKCLAPLDAVVHIIGTAPNPALRASRYCRRYSVLSPAGSPEARCADINRYCRQHGIDIILPSGMASGFLLSGIRERLEVAVLSLPPTEQLRRLNNKWAFFRLLKEQGLPCPKSRLIEEAQDAQTLDLCFPVIIKPLELDAGRGVVRCDTPRAVTAHVAHHADMLPLLVQEFIPGTDVGLGILAHRGEILASTVQRQRPDGSGIEFIAHDGVQEIGRRLMSFLKYDGIAHFDMRLDERDGSIKILECNPRFWASLPFCMLAGVNYAELGIRLARNQPLSKVTARQISLTFPSRTLAVAFKARLSGRPVSEPSRSALRFTLSDPLPYFCLGAGWIRRQIESLFVTRPMSGERAKTEVIR